LAKIRVLRRAENFVAIAEIFCNLLKPHQEVILIDLANSRKTVDLCLTADNLSDHVVEVNLLHAMSFSCLLVVERSTIQLLETEQIRLYSLSLWFDHVDKRFFGFDQFLGAGFETDLCMVKC
jgi:hypothetical protein